MIGKIIQFILKVFIDVDIIKSIVSFILRKGDLPLKKTLAKDETFAGWFEPWFTTNMESHGAIVFVKRPWSLSWLIAPGGFTHVSVWDFNRQKFLNYGFERNFECDLHEFFDSYTEVMVFKTKNRFFSFYKQAFDENSDRKLLCSGLVERANELNCGRTYPPTGERNPSPSKIIKQIKKLKRPTFHYRVK